jgi:tRNA A58 N-methylase Trm61
MVISLLLMACLWDTAVLIIYIAEKHVTFNHLVKISATLPNLTLLEKIIMRNVYVFMLLLIVLLNTTACATATGGSGYQELVAHPGKYELIYYGYQVDNPSYYKALVNHKEIFITKDAVVPSVQSIFLLEHTHIDEGDVVLDIGTGSGVQAIFAAEKAKKVVASDINPNAVSSTLYNVKHHGMENKIDVRLGDLFAPVKDNEKFDVVIFNIDYPYSEKEKSLWEVHERFFAKVKKYLKPDGTIFYQAGWIRNIPRIMDMIESNGLVVLRMSMANSLKHHREPIVFELEYRASQMGKANKK